MDSTTFFSKARLKLAGLLVATSVVAAGLPMQAAAQEDETFESAWLRFEGTPFAISSRRRCATKPVRWIEAFGGDSVAGQAVGPHDNSIIVLPSPVGLG